MKRIISIVATLTLLLATFAFALQIGAKDTTPLTALRAVRISASEVVVEFSKPISSNGLNETFTSLRWMQMSDGKPITLAWDAGKPLQSGQRGWRFWSETDHTRIVLKFDATADNNALDSFLETTGNQYYNLGHRAYLNIEEKTSGKSQEEINDHEHISDVVSEDGEKLVANVLKTGTDYDAVCLEIETDFNYTAKQNDLFRAERAIRFADTKIAVEFSKPVAEGEITKLKQNGQHDVWVSLRWMDMRSGRVYGYTHVNGKQLGISDAAFWSSDNHSVIVLSFKSKESVDAFMQTTGNAYYEAGCRAYLDIEEKTEKASDADKNNHATLFGFKSADDEELATNLPATGTRYDAVVLTVETDYNYAPKALVTDAPVTDEPADTTGAPVTDEPADTTGAPESDEPTEAPDTADKSTLLASIAAVTALGGAVLILSKKKA